jgi:putative ABC transport system permease protein
MAMVILDGLLLCAAGIALGIGLGLACVHWIMMHPKLGGLFQPEVTPGLIVQSVLVVLLLGLVSGLYPAWRATRLRPMDILRTQ